LVKITVNYWMLCFNGPLRGYAVAVFLTSYIIMVDICNGADWNLLLYLMNQKLEAFTVSCQQQMFGLNWYHFIKTSLLPVEQFRIILVGSKTANWEFLGISIGQ